MNFCNQCGGIIKIEMPKNDNRHRFICSSCEFIHYENPKIVVGTVPTYGDEVLLCLRAIDPRSGYWTLPAGFLENGESLVEGAIRETEEEAMITPKIGPIISVIDIIHANQIYIFFRAELEDLDFSPGIESLDVKMFKLSDIPIKEIAFEAVNITLEAQRLKPYNDFKPIYRTID